MNVKVIIIGVVVIGGIFLFLPNHLNPFPNVPDVADTIKQDLTDLTKKTGDGLDDAMDTSLSFANDKIDNLKKSSEDFLSKQDKIDEKTPTNLEENIFFGKIKEGEITEPQQPEVKGSGGGGGGSSSGGSSTKSNNGKISPPTIPIIIQTPTPSKIPFDTLSLITKKQTDNNVMMKYDDTSGETISVTVIMRNEEKVLFTGQFFSSSFETIIFDASDTPHFIDLVVEHSKHGQIIATAFNPAGNTDTSIYGVFTRD